MTHNEAPKTPGFRRNANDLLGIPEGTVPRYRDFGEEMGVILDRHQEKLASERIEAGQRRLAHAADQLREFTQVSTENAILTVGSPALQRVAEHTIAEMNKPIERLVVAETPVDEEQDTREVMTLQQVRDLIADRNYETAEYNVMTVQDHPLINDDPVSYARNNNIRIRY